MVQANVKELLLSMFLHAWARDRRRILESCVHSSVLAFATLFLRFCIRGSGPAYAGFCLHTRALTCVREMPSKSPTLPIFTFFHLFHFHVQS